MARRMNLGSVAAVVLAIVLVALMGGSFLVSGRMNRDAATSGNSASAPNAPGSIPEQSQPRASAPAQNKSPPLVDSNVPPAGARGQ